MTYPTIFANLAAGNQPASLFDTMFNIAGQQGNLPCTATGTNAISLVPKTNYYAPAAYTDGQIASFQAAATTTGAGTIQLNGLGFLKLFTGAGIQVASGDVVININYVVQYRANLDTGAGGFIILNATVTAIAQPVQAEFKNLVIDSVTNTTVTPTADAVVVQNSGGGTVRLTSFAPGACSTATTGANALDTGTVATSTWYALYAIYNSGTATAASLLSASFTAPTLPSGYTYSALIGAVITDGSGNLMRTLQKGRRGKYVIGSNPANTVTIAHGTAGTASSTSPTLAAVSVAGSVPPNATVVHLAANGKYAAGSNVTLLMVAPTTAWGGTNNGPSGSAGNTYPIYTATPSQNQFGSILLETTTIAWATDSTGGAVAALEWDLGLL